MIIRELVAYGAHIICLQGEVLSELSTRILIICPSTE